MSVRTVSKSVTYQHRANFRKFIATFPPATNRVPQADIIPCESCVPQILRLHHLPGLADEWPGLLNLLSTGVLAYDQNSGPVPEFIRDEALAVLVERTARARGGLLHFYRPRFVAVIWLKPISPPFVW